MPIPDYQTCMLPLLERLSDGKEHRLRDVVEALAVFFRLTNSEREERLPSGSQLTFDNRIGWAKTYLKKAGLLESPAKARFVITQRGLDLLKTKPDKIDKLLLRQFSDFAEFLGREKNEIASTVVTEQLTEDTIDPEEALEKNYQILRDNLAQELLETIRAASPAFFEKLVVDLLVAMGYGGSRREAGARLGKSGDDGIDGIIKEDKLGLDAIYIQAKRWQAGNVVGRPQVQAFAGSLEGVRARKGVFITTSRFTKEALEYVERIEKKIILIDGDYLTQLMLDHHVGVAQTQKYILQKIDFDYFEDS